MNRAIKKEEVTLETKMFRMKLFNENPSVDRSEATIILSDCDGIVDQKSSSLNWAYNLFDAMRGNDWGPEEVSTDSHDDYLAMSEDKRFGYDRVLSSLIFNDSAQTRNLGHNMIPFITESNTIQCMTRQQYEEALHTKSYEVIIDDTVMDVDRLYSLYKNDEKLMERNKFLERMYHPLDYRSDDDVTVEMFLAAAIANNILEAIMFYGGFIFLWSIDKDMPGTSKMIEFIARDERMHVLLFSQAINTILRTFPNLDKDRVQYIAESLVRDAVELEIDWMFYITKGKMAGFNNESVSNYFMSKANEMIEGMGLVPFYEKVSRSPLYDIEALHRDPNKTRTNFFEKRAATYTAKKLKEDGYL